MGGASLVAQTLRASSGLARSFRADPAARMTPTFMRLVPTSLSLLVLGTLTSLPAGVRAEMVTFALDVPTGRLALCSVEESGLRPAALGLAQDGGVPAAGPTWEAADPANVLVPPTGSDPLQLGWVVGTPSGDPLPGGDRQQESEREGPQAAMPLAAPSPPLRDPGGRGLPDPGRDRPFRLSLSHFHPPRTTD